MTYTELFTTFMKFAVVGMSGLALDFGLTFVCKEWLQINRYVANGIGFTTAASSNFVFNRIWTFDSAHPDVSIQYIKFVAVSLAGLFINSLILMLLHDRMKWNFYFCKLLAIGFVLVWNFTLNLIFTFR